MHLIPWRRQHNSPEHREQAGAPVPMREFRSQLDRLFERFMGDPWSGFDEAWSRSMTMIPAIDLSETDGMITIRAEVPGMNPEDIDVQVSGNILTIAGEKKESREESDEEYLHCERRMGQFRRSIELPTSADTEQIEADFSNGVLEIHVQKAPTATARHINVRTSEGAEKKREAVGA